jgi:hypothetical protein
VAVYAIAFPQSKRTDFESRPDDLSASHRAGCGAVRESGALSCVSPCFRPPVAVRWLRVGVDRMRCLAIFAVLILSACVADQTPPPVSASRSYPDLGAERDASTKTYVTCLMRAAKKLDDGKSDPGTIAHAMISSCSAEFEANVEVYSRYLEDGLQGREKVSKSLRESSFGSAIQIVLQNRNRSRG